MMKTYRLFALVAPILPVLAGGAAAAGPTAQPAAADSLAALDRVLAATSGHTTVLTGLLAKLPEGATAGVEKALQASSKGHEVAAQALARPRGAAARSTASAEPPGAAARESGQPALTGLAKARETVAGSFEKSIAVLQQLVTEVPEQARSSVEEALVKVQGHRDSALQNLDRLASMERMERPERPVGPERAEGPERPEQPETPDRPERPERPERPDPPRP